MRNLSTIYPGRINVDGNNPNGTFKNETTPDASDDGTPTEEKWQQDVWGFLSHLLNKAGLSPDGAQENESTSQLFDALDLLFPRNKYFMAGYIFKSSTTNPDEQVDLNGDSLAICEDGITFVEMSAATNINFATILGGSLAADTSYHLFAYLKNDDTVQWHVSTSVAPTIGDIKSALAYRRVLSVLTDAAGDILSFYGYDLNGSLQVRYTGLAIVDFNSVPPPGPPTDLVLSVPAGIPILADVHAEAITTARREIRFTEKDSGMIFDVFNCGPTASATSMINDGRVSVWTNISGQIQHDVNTATDFTLYIIDTSGYTDTRNHY